MEQNSVKREAWEADIAKLADIFNEASLAAAAWAEINPFETEKSAVANAQMETAESILQMMAESLSGVDIKFTTQKREMTLEGQTVTPECRQVEIAIAPVTGEIVEKVTETDENTEETETGSDGGILVQAQIKSDAGELYRYEARYAHSKTPTDIASFSWDDFASVPDYWMDPDGGVTLFGKRDIAILKEGAVMNPERAGVAHFEHTKIVEDGAFKNYTKLKSVRLTHAVSVGEEAFRDCEMLEEAVIPLCRNAADFAFAGCKALKAISFSQCASVGAQAFEDCQALTSVELPLCVSLNDGAFRNCENLTEISLPNCQNIGAEAFKGCKNLKKVSLPKCVRVGNDAFKDCANLQEIEMYGESAGEAAWQIGAFFYDNEDYGKAIEWYRKSAEEGYDRGIRNVGWCYDKGEGVEKNIDIAMEWYLKAYEMHGDYAGWAANDIGLLYDNEIKDYKKAIEWYQRGVELGNDYSMKNLGIMYLYGTGVEKDMSKAMEWCRKAYEMHGDCAGNAANAIGVLYHNEIKDYKKAIEWYQRGAELGSDFSMKNLGVMYEYGNGVEKNTDTAIEWYRKAYEMHGKAAADAANRIRGLGGQV